MPASGWRSPSLFSVFFRSTATAALVALGLWLFLALLWPALAQMLGEVISPSDLRFAQLGLPTPDTLMWQQGLSRISPGTLYGEAVVAMLNPDAQSMTTLAGAVPGPHRLAAAARPEHHAGLAADRQPDRRHDPAVRDRLRGVPAARGQGVTLSSFKARHGRIVPAKTAHRVMRSPKAPATPPGMAADRR